ncbi:MAG: alpha/beta hydrolase [Acidobacteria bacterium]|nr:alpha/beta hydrolase [Acidobacteriota bacterium]
MRHTSRLTVLVAMICASLWLAMPDARQEARVIRGITYATVGERALQLDLHMPAGVANPPLLVWVHGGAWRQGSRASVRTEFARNGFATASVSYRLSTEARFPAMIHDIKAAIRFLRARAGDYGYRAGRIAISGDSAGAHLAALVGVSNGVAALEGSLGAHRDRPSDVQAIVAYYPATNLTSILRQSTPFGLNVRVPALQLLLGGQPDEVPELARLASVTTHVDAGDPPLLIFHGDQDPQMPINQSHELHGLYKALKLDGEMVVVHGAVHGGDVFYNGDHLERTLAFLTRTIGG